MGTIQFDRKYGSEIWKITSSEFSITKNKDQFKVNIWVESYYELIQKIEETGDTPAVIEVVFPLDKIPDFSKKFTYQLPKFEEVKENWDENLDYYCNWYYYEHRDVENVEIEIKKRSENQFTIRINGMVEDPTDGSSDINTKVTIELQTSLKNELKGYWAR